MEQLRNLKKQTIGLSMSGVVFAVAKCERTSKYLGMPVCENLCTSVAF